MQSFAIIPAAGRSRRMGQPKLLMPWGETTVIEQVIAAWRASRVNHVVMVVHPDDAELADKGRSGGAIVVRPEIPPPEMKDSVQAAIEHISKCLNPQPTDVWLMAPADMPQLSPPTINRLLAACGEASSASSAPTIFVPTHAGRRGHPALFPWSLAGEVATLDNQGIDALLARHPIVSIEIVELRVEDFDTPEEYDRLRRG